MTNWRTNLGGAISTLGTTLIGVGVLGSMSNDKSHAELLWWVAFVGFCISAVGKMLHALFAADASRVNELTERVKSVEGNTEILKKP